MLYDHENSDDRVSGIRISAIICRETCDEEYQFRVHCHCISREIRGPGLTLDLLVDVVFRFQSGMCSFVLTLSGSRQTRSPGQHTQSVSGYRFLAHSHVPNYTPGDFFPPVYDCPYELERIGAIGDGGKWVCGLSQIANKPDCVIYSFGLDWDSSFEAELLDRTDHCEVWGFDYIANGFGKKVPWTQRHRTHFSRVGLGMSDSHEPNDEPKLWTLKSLMEANGEPFRD